MKELIIILICIFLIIISVCLFLYDVQKDEIKPILIIKEIPVSFKKTNQTELTSLVSNTSIQGNMTIINLTNGISFIYAGLDIKSGDIISLNVDILKPICSLDLENASNMTIKNNTSVIIQVQKDERCMNDFKAIQVNEWHKINQK